jgi:hypothetical protein
MVKGQICYLWASIDVDTNEILAVYVSRGRGIQAIRERRPWKSDSVKRRSKSWRFVGCVKARTRSSAAR